MLVYIFLAALILFLIAYRIYGRYLDRTFDVNCNNPTPSQTDYDGIDRVPAKAPVLLGHHFSSIAGAGPVVGPIIAGIAFGWLPAFLWIVLGTIFIGGIHDYSSLMASIRHKAKSIGEIARIHMTPLAYRMFLIFIWLALVYVLIVFVDLTSAGFTSSPEVGSSSVFFIFLALAFGLTLKKFNLDLKTASFIFVPLVFAGIYLGHLMPIPDQLLPEIMGETSRTWNVILILYCLIASITPVWALLQPRDYLSSFLLYASLVGAFVGILIGGFELKYPVFTSWSDIDRGTLFPILFITIACGACSGFHSIVASGTTSKQLSNECDARPIGYGAMMLEGLVAVISLFTVAMMSYNDTILSSNPLEIYGNGLGHFMESFGLPFEAGKSFGILAVSTFLLTTLDTSTRLGRYIFEEFFNINGRYARLIATAATLSLPLLFTFMVLYDASGNPVPAWRAVWPVFGATNQLLAGLALLVVFVWLNRKGKPTFFVAIPMLFMLTMTIWALIQLVYQSGFTIIGSIAFLLLCLSIVLIIEAIRTVLLTSRLNNKMA